MNEDLLPKVKPIKPKEKGIYYKEENIFYGSGILKFHYSKCGIKTLCSRNLNAFWKKDERNNIKVVDCKICLKKIKEEIK